MTLLPTCAEPVSAAEDGGVCGDNLTWTYDSTNLTISGTGTMYDYSEENPAPWSEYKRIIYDIYLDEGVTSIGSYAFVEIDRVMQIIIPKSVTSIGSKAFYGCGGLGSSMIYYLGEAPEIAQDAYLDSSNQNYTIFEWDEADKQSYGALRTQWKKAELAISSRTSQLVALNWKFQPEDISFYIYKYSSTGIPYNPQQVTFGPYDNSTYGEKTVTVTVDGQSMEFIYYVTDGSNHLDMIRVRIPEFPEYNGREQVIRPLLSMGTQELTEFNVSFDKKTVIGIDGQITVTGAGKIEGFQKTFYYPVVRADISNASINCKSVMEFTGSPITPAVNVSLNGWGLTEGKDYLLFYENNVNIGLATVRIVGMGNYYGEARMAFRIQATATYPTLQGGYLGKYGEELSDNYKVTEAVYSPSRIKARIGSSEYHMAWYSLYQLVGEEMVLIEERQSEPGYKDQTYFEYDFSTAYEDAAEAGGAVYLLEYIWVDASDKIYGGILVMGFPTKVLDATSMTLTHVEEDGDFRTESLNIKGDNGELGEVQWTSSDESVATAEKGKVTLHKPGKAVISAQYGNMVENYTIIASQQDITRGIIYDYYEDSGARVIWDNRLLTQGIDYTIEIEKIQNGVIVTVTGCGLFAGQLEKTFDSVDSLTNPHTHSYDNSCDGICNSCEFTRDNDHSFSGVWSKDQMHHWRACTACGEKRDHEEHSISPENDQECAICGTLWIPGDIDGNMMVNRDDVVQLLLHVSMPAAFPIVAPADFTGDGTVTRDDVVQLLLHVSMPESFPLA